MGEIAMNEYRKRMWKRSYAPRLFCRYPSVSVSGTVAASLLGNVFLWAPSMWLPGEQSFSKDGGFSHEDGDFSRGDHSQRPTACQRWWSGVQHLMRVEPTGALLWNVWTWDQKGWYALISGGEEWGAGAEDFQMYKLDLKKAEEPEIKLPTSLWSQKKQENSRKVSASRTTAEAFDCVDHNKLENEMGIPEHLTCPLRNLYAG